MSAKVCRRCELPEGEGFARFVPGKRVCMDCQNREQVERRAAANSEVVTLAKKIPKGRHHRPEDVPQEQIDELLIALGLPAGVGRLLFEKQSPDSRDNILFLRWTDWPYRTESTPGDRISIDSLKKGHLPPSILKSKAKIDKRLKRLKRDQTLEERYPTGIRCCSGKNGCGESFALGEFSQYKDGRLGDLCSNCRSAFLRTWRASRQKSMTRSFLDAEREAGTYNLDSVDMCACFAAELKTEATITFELRGRNTYLCWDAHPYQTYPIEAGDSQVGSIPGLLKHMQRIDDCLNWATSQTLKSNEAGRQGNITLECIFLSEHDGWKVSFVHSDTSLPDHIQVQEMNFRAMKNRDFFPTTPPNVNPKLDRSKISSKERSQFYAVYLGFGYWKLGYGRLCDLYAAYGTTDIIPWPNLLEPIAMIVERVVQEHYEDLNCPLPKGTFGNSRGETEVYGPIDRDELVAYVNEVVDCFSAYKSKTAIKRLFDEYDALAISTGQKRIENADARARKDVIINVVINEARSLIGLPALTEVVRFDSQRASKRLLSEARQLVSEASVEVASDETAA